MLTSCKRPSYLFVVWNSEISFVGVTLIQPVFEVLVPVHSSELSNLLTRIQCYVFGYRYRILEDLVSVKIRLFQRGVPTAYDYVRLTRIHDRVLAELAKIPCLSETMLTSTSRIGLHNAQVEVSSSDSAWQCDAETESLRLRVHLSPYALGLHHIGSTSIPGMPAKPIIDLAVAVDPAALETKLPELIDRMNQAGYRYLGDWKRRGGQFFESAKNHVRTHAVQIHSADSSDLRRLLRFRELMLASPDLVRRYSEIKIFLSRVLPRQRGLYFWYKSHWLNDVLLEDRGPRAWGDWWISARYPTMLQFIRRAAVRAISGGRRGAHPMAT